MRRIMLCAYCLLIFVVVSCCQIPKVNDVSYPPEGIEEIHPEIDQDLSPYAMQDSYALILDYVLFYG